MKYFIGILICSQRVAPTSSLSYSYDPYGRIEGMERETGGDPASGSYTYAYDRLGRLTAADTPPLGLLLLLHGKRGARAETGDLEGGRGEELGYRFDVASAT